MTHQARTELIKACSLVGREVPRWTQGAGGNISVKEGGSLWIKASGCRLDAVGPDATVACLPLQTLRSRLRTLNAGSKAAEQTYADTLRTLSEAPWGRASMEAGFHALLPERFVAHFHALSAVVMAQVATTEPRRWRDFVSAQAIEEQKLVVLQATPPGLQLSLAVAQNPDFGVCLLRQHGVILQGQSGNILEHWKIFEAHFCDAFNVPTLSPDSAPLTLAEHELGFWHHYFPDAVVFEARVNTIAPPLPNDAPAERCIDARAAEQDPDAAELWIATQALLRAYPSLQPLPRTVADTLHAMPTEQWRQRVAHIESTN